MGIKKVSFFDFDNTLVEQPDIYKWNPMSDEEDNEYMESKESLEYDFKINKMVKEEYLKSSESEETLSVILTNRTIKLKEEILEILSERDIVFDATLFRNEDRSKGNRMKCYLNTLLKFHNIEIVEFWDDKEKHILDVQRIQTHFPDVEFRLNLI